MPGQAGAHKQNRCQLDCIVWCSHKIDLLSGYYNLSTELHLEVQNKDSLPKRGHSLQEFKQKVINPA